MSEENNQPMQSKQHAPRPQGNRPDIYIQEIVCNDDGSTSFKDIGATWQKQGYFSGKIDGNRSIIVRTYEQREALIAVRKAQKENQGLEQSQTPTQSPSL